MLPDVVGMVTQATSSPAAIHARKEIAELGEFVSNSATSAPAFERGIIAYTKNVCELDVRFLEQIREEICDGYDAFMRVAEIVRSYPSKEKQVSDVAVFREVIDIDLVAGSPQSFWRVNVILATHCGTCREFLCRPRSSIALSP